ncbi:LysR family transcriptional regulator [Bdellovibrio reynosensis]|uniref:LysR family transcriptional regulator n=1 Tax=Bdellovibrio reynosensis TaxID=2835041 RepID=A0ABY4C7X7_9BACT|nr:LysR family transcriptional regulator [Bdellovibrio reynosensis]UOF01020.1 LysR family transcriptional regulator [Bdellovibrio reynosensis]
MTLDQLQVLQTIVKLGSFRAASQELHRAQSAVSYAIRTLESELDFKLFTRDQYRPQLTPQGRAFLKKADDLIFQLTELQETAEFLKRGHEPIIRLAVSALWPLPSLISALKEFKTKFPHTEIKIIHDVLSNDEQLLEDHADIALGHIFNEQSLLVAEELFTVNMVAVCSADHPLAKFKGKATPQELAKHPQIIMSSTVKSSKRSAAIINPDNVISVQDYLTKKEFLIAGLGWGRMPEHLVKEEIKKKSLVTVINKPHVTTVHIARHSQKELGPCGKFLWNYFSHRQKKGVK